MTRKKYMKLYNEEKDINLTDEDLKEWIDKIIKVRIQEHNDVYDLRWGELKNCIYPNEIMVCHESEVKVHIHCGIELLAKALGKEIQCRTRTYDTEYPLEYYFDYNGARIFEIRKKKDEVTADD